MESHAASLVCGSGHRHQPPSQAGPIFGAHIMMTEDDLAPIWGVPECTGTLPVPHFGEARTSSSSSMTRHASGITGSRGDCAAVCCVVLQ
jgi:hypothetical protein